MDIIDWDIKKFKDNVRRSLIIRRLSFNFQMRPSISIRGCVSLSVHPSMLPDVGLSIRYSHCRNVENWHDIYPK